VGRENSSGEGGSYIHPPKAEAEKYKRALRNKLLLKWFVAL